MGWNKFRAGVRSAMEESQRSLDRGERSSRCGALGAKFALLVHGGYARALLAWWKTRPTLESAYMEYLGLAKAGGDERALVKEAMNEPSRYMLDPKLPLS